MSRYILGLFLFLAPCLISCEPFINSRGNMTILENVDSFIVGKTTMDEVLSKCGTPSLHKDNFTWIYISARSEEQAFHGVQMKNRVVVKLTFDSNRILKDVEKNSPKNIDSLLNDDEFTNLISEKEADNLIKKKA